MGRMCFFIGGLLVGYQIAIRYDLKKIIQSGKREISQDSDIQNFLNKAKKMEKQMQKQKKNEKEDE